MRILVIYKEEIFLGEVIKDYTVLVDYTENKINLDKVELTQCKNCGIWCNEDEELYGKGYCINCVKICCKCEKYFLRGDLIVIDGIESDFICKGCGI